jgi:steroid 5-alpha reductase family enzyme
MLSQALEKILAVVFVLTVVIFIVANIPTNPQVIDLFMPVVFGVVGVIWILAYQRQQQRRNR